MISPGDLDLFVITDDPQEAVERILDYMKAGRPAGGDPDAARYRWRDAFA
jgi:predicted Rossmann-fold nucleotide-binding protein